MGSKLISIREDIYYKLKKLKRPNESFSEVIERLILSHKKDPLRHFGIGKELSQDIINIFEKTIIESRKIDRMKLIEKNNNLWFKENDSC